MKNKIYLYFCIALLFLNGCVVGPKYQRPCTPVPEHWKYEEQEEVPNPDVENWWEIFEDPVLDSLELQAMRNNKNLFAALFRVHQTRALAGIHKADLYPQVNLDPDYSSTNGLMEVFGLPATLPPILRAHQMLYALPFNLKYELDLWGKLKSQYWSSLRRHEAQEMAFQASVLILTSELASIYFQVRSLDAQLDILKEFIGICKEDIDINQERYHAGLINYVDVLQAERQYQNAYAQYFDLLKQRALSENRIALLIGVSPTEVSMAYSPVVKMPPKVPSGVPSEVLLKRPDIREAERRSAAEHALVGAAYASFFPSFSLTNTLGFSSPDLHDFLSRKSRLWAIDIRGSENIFDGGRNRSQLSLAWARFREADAHYQQQVLVALEEVESALANLKMQDEEIRSLEKAVKASQEAVYLTTERYRDGVINYLEVVDSERTELELKRDLVNRIGRQYISTIHLIKALGGLWALP
ncbi:efflux transporter outer membrane subunit [Parachlamydia sp. AcF125]|uniref:efflux transporter outer membrane subunit n=1 Tax=Parachlamydia sp. AcF125 TaxID=2795736 RepID=UPI001BC907E6|nr:efflux transporter outer membrane subunit [Parachlamydia sp. AcF125]MBS4168699.1 Outer membrane protein OprM [Parachlamydia sp. AcF125]